VNQAAAVVSDEERLVLREWSRRVVAQRQAQFLVKPAEIPAVLEEETDDDVRS
jgi:hypothetical protein